MSKEVQRQGLKIGLGRNVKLKESQIEKSSTDWNILSIPWSNNVISFIKIKQTILKRWQGLHIGLGIDFKVQGP